MQFKQAVVSCLLVCISALFSVGCGGSDTPEEAVAGPVGGKAGSVGSGGSTGGTSGTGGIAGSGGEVTIIGGSGGMSGSTASTDAGMDADVSVSDGSADAAIDGDASVKDASDAGRDADASPKDAASEAEAIVCPSGTTVCGTSCADLSKDKGNCGNCGHACVDLPNAVAVCQNGTCTNATCKAYYGDCDGNAANGCETKLFTSTDCGICKRACGAGTLCSFTSCIASCPVGESICPETGSCADVMTDPNNCGECGTACSAGTRCASGLCKSVCLPGSSYCASTGQCEDLSSTNNCGSCGNVCRTGMPCTNGACACPTGQIFCADIPGCVNPATDSNNCGTCGHACGDAPNASSVACKSGSCSVASCNPYYGDCDGNVANGCETPIFTSTDCGSCGNKCSAGMYCNVSTCQSTCSSGQMLCPVTGSCADLKSDPNNCGTCGHACLAVTNGTAVCLNGTCGVACSSGYTNCNGACINDQGDPNNCGGCGKSCPQLNSGAKGFRSCKSGTCTVLCNYPMWVGYQDCDGNIPNGCETYVMTDTANCGACRNACAANGWCSSYSCYNCPNGQTRCPSLGICADLQTDSSNCGGCGMKCGVGTYCSSGSCISVCSAGQTYCTTSSSCKDLFTDPSNCGNCGNGCQTGMPCTNGSCTCPSGQAFCSNVSGCLDLQSDSNHCGSCSNVCQANGSCISGVCHGPDAICVNKTQGFPCLSGTCRQSQNFASSISPSASTIFECLNVSFRSSSTMIVYFDYYASAGSCTSKPLFIGYVGTYGNGFTFPSCNVSGSSSMTFPVAAGLTISNVSFSLSSGDWGASVRITSIVFQ
jgi:hypothetical protein